MHIAMGCDHRGLNMKQVIMKHLPELGYDYCDFGCYEGESVDYPDIAQRVAGVVASGEFDLGVLICGTGIGMSIAANKVKGIRAALCYDAYAALRSRQHNNANILCLRGEDIEASLAIEIVRTYLGTNFDGGRHARRLDKIKALEMH